MTEAVDIQGVEDATGPAPEISGTELREIRRLLGMSATAFGDAIGVYPGTLIRWENGQQPMNNARMVRLAVLGFLSEGILSRLHWSPFVRSVGRMVKAEEDAAKALAKARKELEDLEATANALALARARLLATGGAAAALAGNKEAAKHLGASWG